MLGYQNIVTETNFTGELSSLGLQDKPKEKQICATMRHRISHFNFPSMSHSYPMNFPFSMDWLKGKITGNPLFEIHGKIDGFLQIYPANDMNVAISKVPFPSTSSIGSSQ
jgi:hypothetical protein